MTRDAGLEPKGLAPAPNRHCGLDPQSPERKDAVFAHGRWRMPLRRDGKGR